QYSRLVQRRPGRLQRIAQEHGLRGPASGPGRGSSGHVAWHEGSGSQSERAWLRPRVGHPRFASHWPGNLIHQGRHTDSTQWLPSAKKTPRLKNLKSEISNLAYGSVHWTSN